MRDAEAQLIHDLRNSASVVHAAAVQLHDDQLEHSPELVDRLVGLVLRRSEMMVHLVEGLSVMHHLEREGLRIDPCPVDLADVCRHVIDGLGPWHDTTVRIEVEPGSSVLGDPVWVTRILDNLLGNALRHGGRHIDVRASRHADQVSLTVRDDGPGVPGELRERLFDPYARSVESGKHGGSGLGLSIVRELCAAMGGTVRYDDESGCAFTVTLPAADEASYARPQVVAC